MPLSERSAIITGANQGLGKAIAQAYVRAGASVLLVARNAGRLRDVADQLNTDVQGQGQIVNVLAGDIADPATAGAAAEEAQRCLPNLAILVNNAGVLGPVGRLEDNAWEAWLETLRVNCCGTALMCRNVLPLFRARGYGKIINVSGGGATAPRPLFSAYAASKAAVVRLTETLAEECRDSGIDVNAMAPGTLPTRMLEQVLAVGPEQLGVAEHRKMTEQAAHGDAALKKAAALAVFLASAASDGITGRLLSAVWDDWSSLPRMRDRLARSDVYTLRRIVPADRRELWPAA